MTGAGSCVSVQDSNGNQLKFDAGATGETKFIFQPPSTGTYIVICSTYIGSTPLNYMLSIPAPAQAGIPNVKLAPPTLKNDDEFATLLALDGCRRPASEGRDVVPWSTCTSRQECCRFNIILFLYQ